MELADLSQLELAESKHITDVGVTLYNDVFYCCPLGKEQVGHFFAICEQPIHAARSDALAPFKIYYGCYRRPYKTRSLEVSCRG